MNIVRITNDREQILMRDSCIDDIPIGSRSRLTGSDPKHEPTMMNYPFPGGVYQYKSRDN